MIGIVGLGLIGGSLGLALRGEDVLGYSRSPKTVASALRSGAITHGARELKEVTQAKVIIVATPISGVRDVLVELSPHLRRGSLVMDTASTKVQVMAWAEALLPPGVDFIGGHPMAGKESWGIEAATSDLFQGASFCLVPSLRTSSEAVTRAVALTERVGARPVFLKAEEHDFLVAGISHLPLLISAALVQATAADPAWEQMAKLAAGGFRDVTRLASGNPEMARDICITNAGPLAQWLKKFGQKLEEIRQNLEDSDRIERVFKKARQSREDWLKERNWK